MHKKLQQDLMSIAHRILQMKNKDDIFALKEISQEVYEKLAMLAFVEEYVNNTPNITTTKEELTQKVMSAFEDKVEATKTPVNVFEENVDEKLSDAVIDEKIVEPSIEIKEEKIVYDLLDDTITLEEEEKIEEKTIEVDSKITSKENSIEQPFDELEQLMFGVTEESGLNKEVKNNNERKTVSLEEELQDTISVDVITDLFDNAQPRSLNDKLVSNIQIGLNDRIAFVKNLFEGDQENYNRVISQLNTFRTENEAKRFINKMVKPDYNWTNHEDLENRFLEIIERKFA